MSETTQCPTCKHYSGQLKCLAFPKGIPQRILTGKHDHTRPYDGDKGIRYEPLPQFAKATAQP